MSSLRSESTRTIQTSHSILATPLERGHGGGYLLLRLLGIYDIQQYTEKDNVFLGQLSPNLTEKLIET